MDSELIVIGSSYQCSSPLLEEMFIGKVEKIYALSALVAVSDFSQIDIEKIDDLNKRVIVAFSTFNKAL